VGGVAHAGIFSVAVAAAVAFAPAGKAGRAVALVNVGVAPALALGLPAATAAGTAWGWRWPFAAMTVILIALALAAARILPVTNPTPAAPGGAPTTRRGGGSGVLAALRSRGLQLVGLTTVVLTVGHYGAYTYVTPLLLGSGVSQGAVSAVLFGYGVAGALGLALAGAFADRRPVGALRTAITVTALALLALAALSDDAAGAIGAVLVWGVAFSAVPTLLNTAALKASTVPDAAPAVVNSMFNVGIAAGAWIGGVGLHAGGTSLVAVLSAALVALTLPLTIPRAAA
jgi:predicted MFS family arabinose efflux permease